MNSESLKAELDRRVRAAQDLMRAQGLDALVAVCAGAPHHNGWIRYFTDAEMWGGRVFVIREARRRNITALRALGPAEWQRRGRQEGVGAIALCDVPAMMAEHDAAHREEIETWKRAG